MNYSYVILVIILSNLIQWYKQDHKTEKNADINCDDDNLEVLPYFLKNSTQSEIEKILEEIKEVNKIQVLKT